MSSSPSTPSRRGFARLLAGAGVAAASLALPGAAAAARRDQARIIKPKRLREGDTVALITPSGWVNEEQIAKAVRNVESLGLKTRLGKHVREQRGNYAGTVEKRLEDFHWAFADDSIDGIWCITGGSGGISLLNAIDYKLVKKHPKVFVGYSDTTCLHLALHRQTGLVTFHAPLGVSTFSDYSREHLRAVLMEGAPTYTMGNSMKNHEKALTQYAYKARSLRPGEAVGRLIGGNLSMVAAVEGTPYGAQLAGKLLFLEDIREDPYRIDRWLTQMHLAHDFNKCAGVVLGVFEKCEAQSADSKSLTLAETIDSMMSVVKVPAVTGYSIGHIADQMTLPLGILARLDSNTQSLTLLEPAVV